MAVTQPWRGQALGPHSLAPRPTPCGPGEGAGGTATYEKGVMSSILDLTFQQVEAGTKTETSVKSAPFASKAGMRGKRPREPKPE